MRESALFPLWGGVVLMNNNLPTISRVFRRIMGAISTPLIKTASFDFLVLVLIIIAGQVSTPAYAQDEMPAAVIDNATNAPPDISSNASLTPVPASLSPETTQNAAALVGQAVALFGQGRQDDALVLVNKALLIAPDDGDAFVLRGAIYTQKKQWDQAEIDFQTALRLDPKNTSLRYDLADLKFKQMKFDDARSAFIPLRDDYDTVDMGDLVKYKIFLCDLFGNHNDVAAKELDAFNQAGANPSYYFGNCAWSMAHNKPDEARVWLVSAAHIYSERKQKYYLTTLEEMDYLPPSSPPGGK